MGQQKQGNPATHDRYSICLVNKTMWRDHFLIYLWRLDFCGYCFFFFKLIDKSLQKKVVEKKIGLAPPTPNPSTCPSRNGTIAICSLRKAHWEWWTFQCLSDPRACPEEAGPLPYSVQISTKCSQASRFS